jgi:hypothetical protein
MSTYLHFTLILRLVSSWLTSRLASIASPAVALAFAAPAPGLASVVVGRRAAAATPSVWSALALVPHAVSSLLGLCLCQLDLVSMSTRGSRTRMNLRPWQNR